MDTNFEPGITVSEKEDLSDEERTSRDIIDPYAAELRCGISLVDGPWASEEGAE